jgi:hypothetical protein
MSDDLSIPDGVYKDAKRLIKFLATPIIKPFQQNSQQKSILRSFSDDFLNHSNDNTNTISYFHWEEEDEIWQKGNGLMCSSTYGELHSLWANPDMFVIYEAHLKRFIDHGGSIRRVFLVGGELADPVRLCLLQRALLRHEMLGFKPRILSILDLKKELRELGINCTMVAVINGRVSYFFRFPESSDPLMIRTIDKKSIFKAEETSLNLWKKAEEFPTWYQRQKYKLSSELIKQVELEASAVSNVSAG